MTEHSEHPTSGRRRRHKSPASIPPVHDLPLPRLLDHTGAEDGPSCSEDENAKRQRSASTTPRSTMGTLPYEYDRVMGRLLTTEKNQNRLKKMEMDNMTKLLGLDPVGEFHGGFGSASLRECMERVVQSITTPSATCHSGEGMRGRVPHMTNPPKNKRENDNNKTNTFCP